MNFLLEVWPPRIPEAYLRSCLMSNSYFQLLTAASPRPDRVCIPRSASPSETLLTSSAVVKWDGRDFGAFPGCITKCFTLTSWFLLPRPAKVTIYATRCRHFLGFFLLLRAYKESWEIEVHPPKTPGKRRSVCVLHLEEYWKIFL